MAKTTRRPRVSIKTRDLMRAFEKAAEARVRGVLVGADKRYQEARAAFVRHLVAVENPGAARG